MTSADWAMVKAEYVTTDISVREICAKYGVGRTTVWHHAKREGWSEARAKHRASLATEKVKQTEKEALKSRDLLYSLASKVARQLADLTSNKSVEELAKIGIKPREITGAIKDLGDALHLKSESDLEEQKARIAKLRKEVEQSDEDKTIRVVIDNEGEEYSG